MKTGTIVTQRDYLTTRTKLFLTIAASTLSMFFASVSFAQSSAPVVQPADWAATVSAANKEGKVVLYANTFAPLNALIKTDFEAAYPNIKLEHTRIVGTPIITKLTQEKQGDIDGADVVFTYEILWLADAKNGMFRQATGPAARTWPAKYFLGAGIPLLAVEPLVLAYNTNLLKTEITGYRDLLLPELRGKIGTSALVSPVVNGWYEWLEGSLGADFLVKFAAQRPNSYAGSFPVTQAAVSGEVQVAAFSLLVVSLPLIASGAPLKIVVPKPALGIGWGGAVLDAARRPNAARVFMDYIMSARGQTVIHGRGESASPLPNIPRSQDINSISLWDVAKYTPEVAKASSARLESILGKR